MYDLIVIGGGPAGYLASERAAKEGLKVLLFEERSVGGVCLNEGCVPTKTFLYSAKLKDGVAHGDKYGVIGNAEIDHKKVVERKDGVVKFLVGGVSSSLKKLGVKTINAKAKIVGKKNLEYIVEAEGEKYSAKYLLIATGSSALVPPIEGVKESVENGFALTNREILKIEEIPNELVVIGGGVIGLEMASYFNSAGSKVTVIEMLEKIGGTIDNEIAENIKKNYEQKGITFKLGCKVVKVADSKVYFEEKGEVKEVNADKVLLSIGRRANTKDLGLEAIGVSVERGNILTDEKMRTNQPNVYAAGDVNGKIMLAHTAYREAEVAVNNMLGKKDKMKYNTIPSVIYTNPEVGSVGLTEEQAKKEGLDVIVKKIPMQFSGRYVAENEGGNGFIKIVVDKKWNTLLGVHAVSNYASEFIVSAAVMMEKQFTIDEIKKVVFPHPTVSEIIREAIFQI